MKKIKTYVLMVSRFFPAGHPKAGQPTGFVEKILSGEKIHTIRSNWKIWKKRIDEVQHGKAVISLRYWSGAPYRSKQVEFYRIDFSNPGLEIITGSMLREYIYTYSYHDGFDESQDFLYWFSKYADDEELGIIHFTPFRYNYI